MNLSNFLALASFTAKLCRRYGYMDPKPLLLFLLRQLHVNDLSFIIVLRELITHMGGIAQLSNLNSKQVENLGAGPILRSKVFESIEDGRDSAGKSGKRLMDSIISLDIFTELFILLNQVHTRFIYNVPEELAYEKVLASRYDDLTHILIQFTEMSNHYLDTETFKNHMMPISKLCIEYGVSVPWAFGIWRQYIGEELRSFDKNSIATESETEKPKEEIVWHPLLQNLVVEIQQIFPDEEWKFLKPGFYITFWQLSLYDIQYPAKNYSEAEEKLKDSIASLNDLINQLENDSRRESHQALKAAKSKKDELLQQQAKLSAESMRHALHFEKSKSRLKEEKTEWFTYDGPESKVKNGVGVRQNQIRQLLSHCILPRTVHSPIDAIFCARFTMLLHSLGTTNFSSLTFFDKLFADGILYGTLLTCTLYEAENLGMFLSEIFSELSRWRIDTDVFCKEGLGKRMGNGETSYLPGLLFRYDDDNITDDKLIDHTMFLRAMEKWHRHTANAIVDCLHSEDYMHRRNTITLLRNMVGVFPVISIHGLDIIDALEDIEYLDDREDLKLAASALLVHLKRCIPTWVELYDYKPVSPEVKTIIIESAKQLAKEREKKTMLRKGITPKPKIASEAAPVKEEASGNSSRRGNDRPSGSLPASLPRIPTGPRRADDANATRGGISTQAEPTRFAAANPPPRRPAAQLSRDHVTAKEPESKSTSANAIEVKPRPGRPSVSDDIMKPTMATPGDEDGRRDRRKGRDDRGDGNTPRRDGRDNNGRDGARDGRNGRDGRGSRRNGRDQTSDKREDREGERDVEPESAREPREQRDPQSSNARDNSRKDRSTTQNELSGGNRGESRNDERNDRRGDRRDGRNVAARRIGGEGGGGSESDSQGKLKGRPATGSNAVIPVASGRLRDVANSAGTRESSPNRGPRNQGRGDRRAPRVESRSGDSKDANDRPGDGERDRNVGGRENDERSGKSDGGRGRDRGHNSRGGRRDVGDRRDISGSDDKLGGRPDSSSRPNRSRGQSDLPNSSRQSDMRSAERKAHMDDQPPRRPAATDERPKSTAGASSSGAGFSDERPRATESSGSWNDDRGSSSNRSDAGRMESRQRNEKEREKRHREWDRDRTAPERDRYRDRGGDYRDSGNSSAGRGRPGQGESNSAGNSGANYHMDRKHNRSNGSGDYEGSGGKRRRVNR